MKDLNKFIDDIFIKELNKNTSKIHIGTAKILALSVLQEFIEQSKVNDVDASQHQALHKYIVSLSEAEVCGKCKNYNNSQGSKICRECFNRSHFVKQT